MNMKDQVIKFDILRNDPNQVEIVGEKVIKVADSTEMLNKWIERPRLTDRIPTLPLSSYKTIATSQRVTVMQRGCFGYMVSKGNDMQNTITGTAIVSGAYGNGSGIYVNAENFEKVLTTFAVRRIAGTNSKWTNDRDQFLIPHTLTDEFTNDCIMWAMANGSNNSSSLKDFPHEGKDYTVKNEFFPFQSAEITRNWNNTLLGRPERTTHCATVLSGKIARREVSSEAQALYDALKAYYTITLTNIKNLSLTFRREEYLTSWDLGYRQIQAAYNQLKELSLVDGSEQDAVKDASKVLEQKILPKIYDYGFLPTETWYD